MSSYFDPNDDLATAQKPFRVVACLPVYGRLPLLYHTITRLYKKNGVHKVVCAGDGAAERELCERLGAAWVPHQNRPLGAKWNAAFKKAAEYNPDAVLYVGSSDFVSDNWLPAMQPYVEQHGFAGVAGCHFIDIGESNAIRMCYWPGYKFTRYHRDRGNETIGIGRMIAGKVMEKIGWEPFDKTFDNSLDRSMKDRIRKYAGLDDHMVKAEISAVSISTNRWGNKHNFTHHYSDFLPSEKFTVEETDEFVRTQYPEITQIFE